MITNHHARNTTYIADEGPEFTAFVKYVRGAEVLTDYCATLAGAVRLADALSLESYLAEELPRPICQHGAVAGKCREVIRRWTTEQHFDRHAGWVIDAETAIVCRYSAALV